MGIWRNIQSDYTAARRNDPAIPAGFRGFLEVVFCTPCLLYTSDIPDSLAYDLCKSLWENKANLAKAVKDIDELTPQIAVPKGVPTQAGALKFWKEQQAKTKK